MVVEVTATKLFFHYKLKNMELSVLPLKTGTVRSSKNTPVDRRVPWQPHVLRPIK